MPTTQTFRLLLAAALLCGWSSCCTPPAEDYIQQPYVQQQMSGLANAFLALLPPDKLRFHFDGFNRAVCIGQHKIRGIVRRRELHIAVFFFRQHSKPAVQLYLHDLATLDFG